MSLYDGWCRNHQRHHPPKNSTGSFSYRSVDCPLVRPAVLPIMSIGDSGIGINSRLGGHCRGAGHYLRKEHRRYCSILWTPEFRTSKLCSICFELVHLAKARRRIGDKWKTMRINGAMVCSNPECRGHKCGHTIRGRDTQATVNICLVGLSRHDPKNQRCHCSHLSLSHAPPRLIRPARTDSARSVFFDEIFPL